MPRNRSEKLPAIPESLVQYRDALTGAVEHIETCTICDETHLRTECGAGVHWRDKFVAARNIPDDIATADTWSDLLDKTLAYIKANYSAAPTKGITS